PAPDPDGARRAAGLPPAPTKPGVPAFLSPPPEPSLSNSPELRRILLLGIGLLVLIVVTLLSAPRGSSDPGPSTIVSPGPAAPPMSHEERVQTLFGGALLNVSDGGDFVESPGYL